MYRHFATVLALALITGLSNCGSIISHYDLYAYTQTTSLKVDALNLIDLSGDSFANHQSAITILKLDLKKMYEYEQHRPKNQISTELWATLLSDKPESKEGVFGFFNVWQSQGTTSAKYRTDMHTEIAKQFDQIAELESAKIKDSEVKH